MTGAMYAAISGLKSHMSKLNVIGNNVANANTYAYKASRMTFRESMYTTVTAGSDGGATRGGVNPSQIGFGVSVGNIDLNMASATYAPTGYNMDCMIDGDGFFMVQTPEGKEKLLDMGLFATGTTPAEMTEIMKTGCPAWGEAVKRAGVEPE